MPHHRRSVPSTVPVFSPAVLIVLIPIATFIILFLAVPPVLSFTSNIFRPTISIKKRWNSLNMLLVLFAIVCGVFARRNNDDAAAAATTTTNNNKPHVLDSPRNTHRIGSPQGSESDYDNPQQWFGDSDNAPAGGDRTLAYTSCLRSSSYPDLRQLSPWENDDDQRFQFRFSDDIEIDQYSKMTSFIRRRRSKTHVHVEAMAILMANETPPPGPPPPPPPPLLDQQKLRRAYRTAEREEKEAIKKLDQDYHTFETVPSSTPTPPPLLPKPERRRSNVKREIATALASLYNQKKRKKNQKNSSQSPPELQKPQSCAPPPSPPPLPPPPSSVFDSLFKKRSSKGKRIHSVPVRHPPKPPLPAKPRPSSPCHYDDNASSGCQSPLIPIPPPPPLPFKVAEWRFDVCGDYVQIQSAQSSSCESPEPDYTCQSETLNVTDGGGGIRTGPTFCPTPDVNVKADTFIARLYDEWRLERINSLRQQKQKL